ncbi:MAG: ATP-binding protein [Cyanobacteria bacterium P01_G01_bin.54]
MTRFTAPKASNRLQRNLQFYSTAGVFWVSLVVALVSATPLYNKLKTSQEHDLQANLQTRILAVNQALKRKVDIAEQITSRTRGRQLLEAHVQGTGDPTEVQSFSSQILTDAMEKTQGLVGITRFDQNQQQIATVGVASPLELSSLLKKNRDEPSLIGPILIEDSPHLLVIAPIFSEQKEWLGQDIAIFKVIELQKIATDYSGLGDTGQMILAQRDGETVKAFFPLRDGSQILPEALNHLLERAIAQDDAGIEHHSGQVIAFEPIPKTNWGVAVWMERQELYAAVNNDLILVGVYVLVFSGVATIGVVLILRPLIGRVMDAHELEKEVLNKTAALEKEVLSKTAAFEELKQTQIQLVQAEKMSSLGQLVAGIAHEINNPINFIHGNLSYLETYAQNLLKITHLCLGKHPELPPDIAEALEELEFEYIKEDLFDMLGSMEAGSNRILELVLSLRNFSRLDESELKFVNIHEGIDSTLLLLQDRINPKSRNPGVKITKVYGNIPKIECYASQLNQVFMNLLTNALDALAEANGYEPEHNPAMITITTEMAENNVVAIKIADNGSGIPDEVHYQLFEPFFTTKPVGQGTGMGLSISQQIIHQNHHGKLFFRTQLGVGTEFVIEVPLRQISTEEMGGSPKLSFVPLRQNT